MKIEKKSNQTGSLWPIGQFQNCPVEMMNYDKEIAKDSSTIELYRIYFEKWGKVNQTGRL